MSTKSQTEHTCDVCAVVIVTPESETPAGWDRVWPPAYVSAAESRLAEPIDFCEDCKESKVRAILRRAGVG